MLQKERYERIYSILQERNGATVQYLKKRLYVSEATIRRDLEAMEADGLLKRVWGGAMPQNRMDKDPPIFVRNQENTEKKEKIAKIASRLLHNSMVISMDSSTTCMQLVPYIAQFKQVSVVTFGLHIQQMLSEQTGASVHLLGGEVYEKRFVSGHVALENARQYHVDTYFFSGSGISADQGVTGSEAKSVEVSREMLRRAKQKVLLCDTTKVGKNYMWSTATLDEIDYVIMDSIPDDEALVACLGSKLITNSSQLSQSGSLISW